MLKYKYCMTVMTAVLGFFCLNFNPERLNAAEAAAEKQNPAKTHQEQIIEPLYWIVGKIRLNLICV